NLMKDLQDRKLIFPENFSYMRICDIYARGIFIGKISPDNFDVDRDTIEYLYKFNHDFKEY
ncbi:MAG: hypothetical protein K2J36_03690, partial [Ruminococcus sp.]|nr:hypothetical protein [Ruminococcus sp.]